MARMLARLVMSALRPMDGPQFERSVPATPMPTPYLSVISLAVALAESALRSTQTMCAPSLTRRCATSLPMPERCRAAPPVRHGELDARPGRRRARDPGRDVGDRRRHRADPKPAADQ